MGPWGSGLAMMIKIQKHIEIVCSTRPGLSSMSKQSREAILVVLAKHYTNVSITIVNNLAALEAVVARKPDLVFLGMKFIPMYPALNIQDDRKIWISQYLAAYDIASTGSNHNAHKLELNKDLAKQCALDAGLMTSPYYVARQNQPIPADDYLTYPLFIKPTNRGGGTGIDSCSVANNAGELLAKVTSIATDFQADSLVEEYLPGREFSVAILKNELTNEYSTMPLELIAPLDMNGARLLSEEVKSADTEKFVEVTDLGIKQQISSLAINIFHAMGARDYGRIDIRLDKSGIPHFLEANLIPSLLQGYGNFPKACLMNTQLDYEPMILNIVRLGLARKTYSDAEFVTNNLEAKSLELADITLMPLLV